MRAVHGDRSLHVRDAEAVDPPVLLEALRLEPGDVLQPGLAPRVRRVEVPVEHERRAAASPGPGSEHVGAPVGRPDVDRVAGPDVPAHRLREGGDLVGPLVEGQIEAPPDDVVVRRIHHAATRLGVSTRVLRRSGTQAASRRAVARVASRDAASNGSA